MMIIIGFVVTLVACVAGTGYACAWLATQERLT